MFASCSSSSTIMRKTRFTMLAFYNFLVVLSLALLPGATWAQSSAASSSTAAVTSNIGTAPAGCATTRPETFDILITPGTGAKVKRSLGFLSEGVELNSELPHTNQRRDNTLLILTLTGGTIVEASGRVGFVATDGSFQFQHTPLPNQLYTGPFSICANSTLALGGTANWYQCLNGSSYSLYYFESPAVSDCTLIHIEEDPINSTSTSATLAATSFITVTPSSASVTSSASATTSAAQLSSTVSAASNSTSHAGAIAGGVVGGVLGLALLLGVGAFFLLRRRKQQRQQQPQQQQQQQREPSQASPAEVEAKSRHFQELDMNKPASEVHNHHMSELYGSNMPELSGEAMR